MNIRGMLLPVKACMASEAPFRICLPSMSTPLILVCAEKAMNFAFGSSEIDLPLRPYFFARTTMLLPSGVSSARDASCAAFASSSGLTPGAGINSVAWRSPRVMVPVLSRSKYVHISCRLNGTAAHGQYVFLDHAVDPCNADSAQKPSDRGGDETDKQSHQDGNRKNNA